MKSQMLLVFIAACLVYPSVYGQQSEKPVDADLYEKMVDRAMTYLSEQGQAENGSFSEFAGPGVTALVATSLMKNGVSADEPIVRKALDHVKSFVQPTGGIHAPESLYKNYETSLAMVMLATANSDGRHDKLIANAMKFIKGIQWTEQRNIESSDTRYGGFGYGKHGRPDLSNTAFTIEALRAAGVGEDDEAIQRALMFVSRTQNHESAHNTTPHPAKNPDGGHYYTPSGEGESPAGKTANGGLRSYASMTYAGLKSMLYAGVDKDDSRVKAALEWISRHYDLKTNPGMGAAGLYYYYHVFAKTLDAMGEDVFIDTDGQRHDWRKELLHELADRQNDDGSWTNSENDRWMEGDPNLVTGYVLLALSYCKPK